VRAIVADLGLTRRQESTINRILTVLGVVMVAWGDYLTWHLVARAA
jgi:hypothetical protein